MKQILKLYSSIMLPLLGAGLTTRGDTRDSGVSEGLIYTRDDKAPHREESGRWPYAHDLPPPTLYAGTQTNTCTDTHPHTLTHTASPSPIGTLDVRQHTLRLTHTSQHRRPTHTHITHLKRCQYAYPGYREQLCGWGPQVGFNWLNKRLLDWESLMLCWPAGSASKPELKAANASRFQN